MSTTKFASAVLALAASAIMVPAAVRAEKAPLVVEGQTGNPTIYVGFADLNLGNSAGVDRLQGRVRRAAEKLCIEHQQPLNRTMAGFACRDEAVSGAQSQIETAIAGLQSGNTQFAAASRIAVSLR